MKIIVFHFQETEKTDTKFKVEKTKSNRNSGGSCGFSLDEDDSRSQFDFIEKFFSPSNKQAHAKVSCFKYTCYDVQCIHVLSYYFSEMSFIVHLVNYCVHEYLGAKKIDSQGLGVYAMTIYC